MTPMVDVTFLLLIFFMVTAAFAMQSSIVVPKYDREGPTISLPQEELTADIVVEVDEFSTFHVTVAGLEQEAPSEHDLIRVLRQVCDQHARTKPPSRMLVKANPDALHEKVIAALDSGAYVGIPEIELLTLELD
ncbi:MAG: biopolymer transporter ExbD [Planctomycetaceae bacterium]|nr:biopolymer transporter ExbD [Planctomycetales bacterium]MCB9921554.1 biopolymer transporter ExbD [Planctomycetaceae bacterium]